MTQIKKLRSFAQKMTKLAQFLSGPAAFFDIHDFSKIAVFKDSGGCLEIHTTGTVLWPPKIGLSYMSRPRNIYSTLSQPQK